MKKALWILMAMAVVGFPFVGVSAMDKGHGGHEHGQMDHSGHSGKLIREAKVEGYSLAYHLIDMREKMKGMKGMQGMPNTHHLMVFIQAPNGQKVENATVGFLVKGPSGEQQKAMAMGMGGGFGADLNLTEMGAYSMKTKVVADGKNMMDAFEHHRH